MAGQPDDGELRTAIANRIVTIKKEHYGRGPEAARAWLLDDYVFVAMEGGLMRNEDTLLRAGKHDEVRAYRLAWQEAMTIPFCTAIEELTGRSVLTYHSQIVFDPVRTFEIFVLAPDLGDDR